MSVYNPCPTYVSHQNYAVQNFKSPAPSSISLPSFSPPQLLPLTNGPSSTLQCLPIAHTNSNFHDWHCPVKTDVSPTWSSCIKQSITKLDACKFNNVSFNIGSQKYSEKGSDDEQSNLSAFLGPNLWEKSCGTDFKLEYMDLDEFLVENGIPTDPIAEPIENDFDQSSVTSLDCKSNIVSPSPASPTSSLVEDKLAYSDNDSSSSVLPTVDMSNELESQYYPDDDHEDDGDGDQKYINEADDTNATKKPGRSKVPGSKGFDPTKRRFTTDELKPQPLVKKSRKVFVPDEHKDEKYWARRKKNNVAAKRSRDARRVKENQIALRANFLESENQAMKAKYEKVLKEFSIIKRENETLTSKNLYLQKQLNKFTL